MAVSIIVSPAGVRTEQKRSFSGSWIIGQNVDAGSLRLNPTQSFNSFGTDEAYLSRSDDQIHLYFTTVSMPKNIGGLDFLISGTPQQIENRAIELRNAFNEHVNRIVAAESAGRELHEMFPLARDTWYETYLATISGQIQQEGYEMQEKENARIAAVDAAYAKTKEYITKILYDPITGNATTIRNTASFIEEYARAHGLTETRPTAPPVPAPTRTREQIFSDIVATPGKSFQWYSTALYNAGATSNEIDFYLEKVYGPAPVPTPVPAPTPPIPTPLSMQKIIDYLISYAKGESPPPLQEAIRLAGFPDIASILTPKTTTPFDMAFALIGISPVTGPAKILIETVKPTIVNLAAEEILAKGLLAPGELRTIIKSASKEEVAALFGELAKTTTGREAISVIQRVVLDARAPLSVKKALAIAGGAAAGLFGLASTLNFLGFLGEEAIQTKGLGVFQLVSNKEWTAAANELLSYRASVDAISKSVDGLMNIPILSVFLSQWWPNYKSAAYGQISSYEKTIAAGLASEAIGTTISIDTNVNPALATITGIFLHKQTPFTAAVAAGAFDLEVEKEGYYPKTVRLIVKERQDNPATIALVKIEEPITAHTGRLQLAVFEAKTSAAIKGTLYIEENAEAYHLHSYTIDLAPELYALRVEEPGYDAFTDSIQILEGETTTVRVELEKTVSPTFPEIPPAPTPTPTPGEEEKTGKVEINCNVTASILLAGQDTGKTTPALLELVQGIYSVTLEAEGYESKTTTALIKAGELSKLSINLVQITGAPVTAKLWRVDVNSYPSGAKILVNYAFTDRFTPDYVLLDPGQYIISLTKSQYVPWETPITLEAIEGA